MRGAKNQKIFQPKDETRARKLPKYDFAISMVNITPGTYRIMSEMIQEIIDGQQEIQITDDATYVFVKPKYFLGSSGSVWASEFMHLRYEVPRKFEATVETSSITDKASTGIYIMLTDAMRYYLDSSEREDIVNISYI